MSAPNSPPPVVELTDVYKYHRTQSVRTAALNGMSFRVAAGEFVAVTGPSGSGKSTLLNVIGLIDEADAGVYTFRGRTVGDLSRRQRAELRKREMGFVFQSFNLIDELTAAENVALPLVYQRVPAAERRRRVAAALADLEMGHRADHYPRQLSGGQQQRVAIARTVITNPSLILADEPTGNLDSVNGRAVMETLARFHAGGATIVMVTHSPTDAAYADRTVRLFDGMELLKEETYVRSGTSRSE